MPYVLGIDLGGTRTTAAVSRWEGDGWSRPEVVRLAGEAYDVPSVLHMTTDGVLAVGNPGAADPATGGRPDADHAGFGQPDAASLARGFTRRVGDDVPLAVGTEVWTAEALTAVLAMWVVERVMAGETGTAPEQIVVSHPPGWGTYRRELLHRALWEIGLAHVTLLPEAVTAAESHAAHGFTGRTLAVYSLAEEEFSAAVVRRTPVGFELLNCLDGGEPLGAADFDDALARHVLDHLRERERLREQERLLRDRDGRHDPDPLRERHRRGDGERRGERAGGRGARSATWSERAARAALPGLDLACAEASQRLTVATETDIRLQLPEGPLRVPVDRVGFEEMIRPALRFTVETLVRTVRAAGLRPEQLDGVLLVGTAARIPLIAELVATRTPGPVTVEAEPAVTVALGAAWAAAQIVRPTGYPGTGADRAGRRPGSGPGHANGWSAPGRSGFGPSGPGLPEDGWGPGPGAAGGEPAPTPRPHRPGDESAPAPARPPVRLSPLKLPRSRGAVLSSAGAGERAPWSRTRS